MNEKQMQSILDSLYTKALDGIPLVSKSVEELANEYLSKNSNLDEAVKSFVNNQIKKCGTSGFLTGLGGIITLPITIPANVSSVLYVQIRMIAVIAYMGGFAVNQDQVQALVYVCLTGNAMVDILKQAGIKVGEKFAIKLINKIPGAIIRKINQMVAMRLVTRAGQKGIINLVKIVPVFGGIINAGFDIVSTKIIAKNAYKLFIEKQIPNDEEIE